MPDEKPPTTPQNPEVVDPHNVPVIYVDWLITGGMFEGVVNVALGSVDHSLRRSNDELAKVVVGARLRCSRDFAIRMHRALGQILGLPSTPTEALEDQTPPPKNLIN